MDKLLHNVLAFTYQYHDLGFIYMKLTWEGMGILGLTIIKLLLLLKFPKFLI